jgi:hypothetical protein
MSAILASSMAYMSCRCFVKVDFWVGVRSQLMQTDGKY